MTGAIKMRKKKIGIYILCMFLFLLSGCGSKDNHTSSSSMDNKEKRTFKVAFAGPESHIHYKSIMILKEELEKRSNGRFELELYPNNILGTDAETLSQLQSGSVDMATIITGELANHSESFNAWFMPFLFTDAEAAYEMGKTDEAMDLFNTLDNGGVHPLGYFLIEMRDVLSKDAIISDVSQLEGINIRVTPSPAIVDFWNRFDANATPVDWGEMYSAFQTGVISAMDTGPAGVYSGKFYEIGKYYTKTHHMAFNSAFLINEKLWTELSPEDQKIIQDSMDVVTKQNLELNNQIEEESINAMENEGVTIGELKMDDEFKRVVEDFTNDYINKDEKIKAFVEKAREISSK